MKATTKQSVLDAFHELTSEREQALKAVYEHVEDECRDAILLEFDTHHLKIVADADTDSIEAILSTEQIEENKWKNVSSKSPWKSQIGNAFGWGWVGTNQHGYQDGVLLSFSGLDPAILLSVSASSIRVCTISECAG